MLSRRKFLQQSTIGATGLLGALYTGNNLAFASAKLVDKEQQHPSSGEINCEISYRFTEEKIAMHFRHDSGVEKPVRIIIPVISSSEENMKMISRQALEIYRKEAVVQLSADKEIGILPMTADRIFNFVPGLEALPFFIKASAALVEIEVK